MTDTKLHTPTHTDTQRYFHQQNGTDCIWKRIWMDIFQPLIYDCLSFNWKPICHSINFYFYKSYKSNILYTPTQTNLHTLSCLLYRLIFLILQWVLSHFSCWVKYSVIAEQSTLICFASCLPPFPLCVLVCLCLCKWGFDTASSYLAFNLEKVSCIFVAKKRPFHLYNTYKKTNIIVD